MYSSKDSQFTPICLAKKKINLCSSFLCLLILFLFSGCDNKNSTPTMKENVTPTITIMATPTTSPKLDPTPTIKPPASVSPGDELTTQSAQELIENKIDSQKYTVTLLTEELKIDSQDYIAFVANENSVPLEPIILVSKTTGIVSCLSSEGKCIAFSNFPSTIQQENENLCDWNGTFSRKDSRDHLLGTLQIVQNDSSSFEFYIYSDDSITSLTLAGIGHIEGNYAIFTDESEHELLFTMKDGVINVYDGDENFSSSGLTISGDYTFESYDIEEDYKIGIEKAVELLSRLSMYQTKLPAELSEYSLKSQDSLIIVKDRMCYVIGAYATFEDLEVLMTTFYVSIDGSVIFAYDNISDEPYSVIPLY